METLGEHFVSAWVLAKDLDRIAGVSDDPGLKRVCLLVKERYAYPVDSVLIGSDGTELGHANVHGPECQSPASYLAFLRRGLEGATPGSGRAVAEAADSEPAEPDSRPVRRLRLTPGAPAASILDAIIRKEDAGPSVMFILLDASAFEEGGVVEVSLRAGEGRAAVKVEICAPVPSMPDAMSPVALIDRVEPGATASLAHSFSKGSMLGLAIKPAAGTGAGDLNAFLATVTVRKP